MKRLVLKTTAFLGSLIFVIIIIFLLPPAPNVKQDFLFAQITKDSLLINTPSPRIILLGGSNVAYSINSKRIRDSLGVNPVNSAISADLGVKYMLENLALYAIKGDIIVFMPEYSYFFKPLDIPSKSLLVAIFCIDLSNARFVNNRQIYRSIRHHAATIINSKINPLNYIKHEPKDDKGRRIFDTVDSFNEFGDIVAHWNHENRHYNIKPYPPFDTINYNAEIMDEIKRIANKLQERGCTFFISYPSYMETAFNKSEDAIQKIEKEYHKYGFTVLGNPQRYSFPDSLIFDSRYHLNKQGLENRTDSLIEDLRGILNIY